MKKNTELSSRRAERELILAIRKAAKVLNYARTAQIAIEEWVQAEMRFLRSFPAVEKSRRWKSSRPAKVTK